MRTGNRWTLASISAVTVAALGLVVACSAEHPSSEHPTSEHPTSEHPTAEHPTSEHPESEHPKEEAHQSKITKDKLAASIASFIEQDMKLKGGYFMFYDSKDDKILTLKLDHVHRERVAQTANNRYFACADFRQVSPSAGKASSSLRSKEGKLYDLDFWMKRGGHGKLQVSKITLHKEAGEPRYTWHEQDGVWKRKK